VRNVTKKITSFRKLPVVNEGVGAMGSNLRNVRQSLGTIAAIRQGKRGNGFTGGLSSKKLRG